MVSSIARTTPSACLRCQLREALLLVRQPTHTSAYPIGRTQSIAKFSTTSRVYQDSSEASIRRERAWAWRHLHLDGCVIGKPGRRQRVVSERLSTNSLEQPVDVIVLRDFEEPEDAKNEQWKRSNNTPIRVQSDLGVEPGTVKSSKGPSKIEYSVAENTRAPDEDDVNISIEALRPAYAIIGEQQFAELAQKLSEGYNSKQLSRYLVRSVQPTSTKRPTSSQRDRIKNEVQQLSATSWRAGRTPLNERHSDTGTKIASSAKSKIIDQLLRLAWNLTIQSDEQECGELEIQARSWQVSMLFDVIRDGRPTYEHFLDSQLLIDASEIHPNRADKIIRITASRQVAEEIARQLKLALLGVQRYLVDLKPFETTLGKPGWPNHFAGLFRDTDLSYVSGLTQTVIQLENKKLLAVYSINSSDRRSALHRLLSLLDMPSPKSFNEELNLPEQSTIVTDQVGTLAVSPMPTDVLINSIHQRYRDLNLVRMATPCFRRYEKEEPRSKLAAQSKDIESQSLAARFSEEQTENLSRSLAAKLDSVPSAFNGAHIPIDYGHSYWNSKSLLRSAHWKAQFCKILQFGIDPIKSDEQQAQGPQKLPDAGEGGYGTDLRIAQTHIPAMETMLSHFARENHAAMVKPRLGGIDFRIPYLTAHFMPSPFVADGGRLLKVLNDLPRIQMHFRLNTAGHLYPVKMEMVADEQILSVPLPGHAVDLQFTRSLRMFAGKSALNEDKHIADFVRELQQSVQTDESSLATESELLLRLPAWLVNRVQGKKNKRSTNKRPEDVEVRYFMERFEQYQTGHFLPIRHLPKALKLHKDSRKVIEKMPKSLFLEYREIEGGEVHGSTRALTLRRRPNIDSGKKSENDAGNASLSGPDQAQRADSSYELASTAIRLANFWTQVSEKQMPPSLFT